MSLIWYSKIYLRIVNYKTTCGSVSNVEIALACLVLLSHVAFAGQKVQFETNLGNFVVELNNEKAPKTVANFLSYVKDGSYVGSIFHRVIPNFMAQGGGFDKSMKPLKTLDPIVNEASNGLKNNRCNHSDGTHKNPNSATRQFFINLKDNHFRPLYR